MANKLRWSSQIPPWNSTKRYTTMRITKIYLKLIKKYYYDSINLVSRIG